MTNRKERFNRGGTRCSSCIAAAMERMLALAAKGARSGGYMRHASLAVASLAAVATFAASDSSSRAADELKVAVGGRGIGETFVNATTSRSRFSIPLVVSSSLSPGTNEFNGLSNGL